MIGRRAVLICLLTLATGLALAQFRSRSRPELNPPGTSGHYIRIEGGLVVNEDELKTARETSSHSSGTPNWTNTPGFKDDVFTFTRVIFHTDGGPRRSRFGRGGFRWLGWWVDYPDADLNFSYRLQQLTSIPTDPDARVIKFTDPAMFDFPIIYIEHAGYMQLTDAELTALQKYLNNGGVLLVNDFWGSEEWEGFAAQI